MPRAKGGTKTRRRHKRVLKLAKGFWGRNKNNFVRATERVEKGQVYAFRDRKAKKREYRALWIARINAQARTQGLSYSRLINGMLKANVAVDRKILADLAIHDPTGFGAICDQAKAALSAAS